MSAVGVDGRDFLRGERLLLTQNGHEGLRIPFVPCQSLTVLLNRLYAI